MGKIVNFLLMSVLIQIALILFANSSDSPTFSSTNSTMSITDIILAPQNWYNNPLFDYLNLAVFSFVGALGIVVGLYIIKNEWIVYAGIGAIFVSFIWPFINLWQFLNAQKVFGDATGIVYGLIMAPFLIYFVVTILDFTRGRD